MIAAINLIFVEDVTGQHVWMMYSSYSKCSKNLKRIIASTNNEFMHRVRAMEACLAIIYLRKCHKSSMDMGYSLVFQQWVMLERQS